MALDSLKISSKNFFYHIKVMYCVYEFGVYNLFPFLSLKYFLLSREVSFSMLAIKSDSLNKYYKDK